jgi:hypothetical protein
MGKEQEPLKEIIRIIKCTVREEKKEMSKKSGIWKMLTGNNCVRKKGVRKGCLKEGRTKKNM